jgi:hypothetical protein
MMNREYSERLLFVKRIQAANAATKATEREYRAWMILLIE